jgi:hypothetical protein
MTTVHAPESLTRPEAAQLLVILFRYLETNIAAFPTLLPAVDPLREAARLYGRSDTTGAAERGLRVYEFLQRARGANPALPVP